jgi:two-component system, OmpR family, sensor histidine kinase ChvG
MKLHSQLIFLSTLTLALPWAGCEYIREMENTLREGQAQNLLSTTKTIAHSLTYEGKDIFQYNPLSNDVTQAKNNIYAHRLDSKILLDGYIDDWGGLSDEIRYFNNQIETSSNTTGFIACTHKSYLYLFLTVKDNHVIYHTPSKTLANGDRLQLLLKQKNGESREYILQTSAPGKITAQYLIGKNTLNPRLKKEHRVQGKWQDTSEGYNIELRIPLKLIYSNINFAIVDIDSHTDNSPSSWFGTWDYLSNTNNGLLIQTSKYLENILNKFKQDNARLRIANTQGWLLASSGSATNTKPASQNIELNETLLSILNQLYHFIMDSPDSTSDMIKQSQGKLSGNLITQALVKQQSTSWYKPSRSNNAVVSASYPIIIDEQVVAVVIADQSSDAILTLTNKALSRLISFSSIAILISITGLLGYATLLSIRIRRLRNATDEVISPDGIVNNTFSASRTNDELGDLSRSFSTMNTRLSEYTQYLKSLASKLSHELRTPLAIVQSSLDNLSEKNIPKDARIYAQRAKDGSERLSNIITAMSEASRVEQSIQSTDLETFNICDVINSGTAAYKDIFPKRIFNNTGCENKFLVHGSPELIIQLLDKLINNAVSFSQENSEIKINTLNKKNHIFVSIINKGSLLPDNMKSQLFDSMVSIRKQKSETPHLGLGLYIVKLIMDAHKGTISARNLEDESGVEFIMQFPVSNLKH